MDVQAIGNVRSTQQMDCDLAGILREDVGPDFARLRWQGTDMVTLLAGPVRLLVSLSPEEILTRVLEGNPPLWEGMPPGPIPPP